MKKASFLTLSLGLVLLFLAACKKDSTDEPQLSNVVTQFESSTMPEVIPGKGGEYTLTFATQTVT